MVRLVSNAGRPLRRGTPQNPYWVRAINDRYRFIRRVGGISRARAIANNSIRAGLRGARDRLWVPGGRMTRRYGYRYVARRQQGMN